METKKCTKCGEMKETTAYVKNLRFKSGLNCECRACTSKREAKYRDLNKERIEANRPGREYFNDWNKNNPSKRKALSKKYQDNLNNTLVEKMLKKQNLPITPETIELKKQIIIIKRFKKQINGKSKNTGSDQ